MRGSMRCGALLIALTFTVGFARAGEVNAAVEDTWSALEPSVDYFQDETTGSIDRSMGIQVLPLSDEQRGLIFLSVINLPDTPDADLAAPEVAETVPSFVALQDLPAMATSRIPLLNDYKFVKLDDRILVVRPGDRMIVSQIPRYRLLQ
jgi:hypothetical protein